MNIKEIQDLIRFVAKSGVNEVEIEQKDFKLTIKLDSVADANRQMVFQAAPAPVAVQAAVPVAPAPVTPVTPVEAAPIAESNLITVKSPMIGTFYRSSGPDKEPFISVGNTINIGDTVCIIEAMKLFNEIESEISGKVVKVLVDDSSPVEYDQPLFLVEPA